MSYSYISSRIRVTTLLPFVLLAVSLLIRRFASPAAIEQLYSRGLFVAFRTVWDAIATWFPIPLFYLFFIFLVAQVPRAWRKAMRAFPGWRSRIFFLLGGFFRFACWVIIVFLWGWGYNYGRISVEDKMGFLPYAMTAEELQNRVFKEAIALGELRQQIVGQDTNALPSALFPTDWEATIRPLLVSALQVHGYPAPGRVRARRLVPNGLLLRWSTAGVYWPWVGEGNIDDGLHHLQKPYVMAHEMAHGYGFGDEGTCNFWAYLTGLQAKNPVLAYAFRLDYWRRIAGRLRRANREVFDTFRREQLSPGILNDLRAIYANNDRYPDLMPAVRDAAYNTYLKAQGIEEGILNYGRVVQLVEGYRRRE